MGGPFSQVFGQCGSPTALMKGGRAHVPMLEIVLVCDLYVAEVSAHTVKQTNDNHS